MAVVAAPKMWNNLPLHINQGSSLSVFKLASDIVGDVDFIYFILSIVFFKNCAAFVQCTALWSIVDFFHALQTKLV